MAITACVTASYQYKIPRNSGIAHELVVPGAQGKAGGDYSWQTLGDSRNRQRNRDFEVVRAFPKRERHGTPVWQACLRVRLPEEEVAVVDDPNQHADPEDDLQRKHVLRDQASYKFDRFRQTYPPTHTHLF